MPEPVGGDGGNPILEEQLQEADTVTKKFRESTEMKVVLVWCQVREGNDLYTGMDFKK